MERATWRLVLPVKGGDAAKSRLAPSGPGRTALALAIGLDTVDSALACPAVAEVVVVSADEDVLRPAEALGARAVAERTPGAGLLAAVADGLDAAGRGPCAVLLADLPSLRPGDLTAALDACAAALGGGASSVVVPDAEGTGSVLLAGTDRVALLPAFGPSSAVAHVRAGAARLDLDLPRLRRDVDTPAELRAAEALGVGPRTRAVLGAVGARRGVA